MANTSRTVEHELRVAAAELQVAGVDTPRLDAELLMCHVTGLTRTQLITHGNVELSDAQARHFRELVGKRRERHPLPYLIGKWEFWGMEFEVNPSVLIPRPETEILVESCVEWLRGRPFPIVTDIGTGSGAIAVAVARELPGAKVYATEISEAAVKTAVRNAERHGVGDRVKVLVGDLAGPLFDERLEGRLDAVVSNPPYIAGADEESLQPEVRREPKLATLAGADRLVFYRRILAAAPRLLVPRGRVFLEIDPGLAAPIGEVGRSQGLKLIETRRDLAGLERVVVLECESSK
ncbi:MAG: peptide chain release factor N(5)-glutamine methyltransferase [Armatimonadota bacterium]|nr:peptide chain release factor N(5)-glutamine methyltransferase [Armatimonadota bacterium]